MTDRRTVTTFAELEQPLRDALHFMLSAPERSRPFVIVQSLDTGTEEQPVFAQFCGSDERPLTFDCPPLGLSYECGFESAVEVTRDALRRQGVSTIARLEVLEHADDLIPRRSLFGLFLPSDK